MKVQLMKLIIIILATFIPAVFAAEKVTIENMLIGKAEQNSSFIPFGTTIVGNDQFVTKTGPVFTESGDYSGMVLPYLDSDPKPILYPRWAINQGWQGRFVIAIEVLTDGTVGRYKVMKSTGHRILDDAGTDAIRTWKFKPAVKDGKITTTCIEVPVTFELQN